MQLHWKLLLGATALLTLVTPFALRFSFRLMPPHIPMPAPAFNDEDRTVVLAAFREAAPADAEALAAWAVAFTGERFSYGRSHPSFLALGEEGREAHPVEYAWLTARAFDLGAAELGLAERAAAVRSPARLLGQPMPVAGFLSHHWVRVERPGGSPLRLDPTLFDLGLGGTARVGRGDDG